MTLILHQHPFAAYCWKPLIALYERDVPFTSHAVNDEADRAALAVLWPLAKIPVLVDDEAGLTLPESTAIIEHLDAIGDAPPLVPPARGAALQARLWDRVLDNHVTTPMQKVVADALRPEDERDAYGVAEARAALDQVYPLLDAHLAAHGGGWVDGATFSLADCAAAPALHYALVVHRWDEARYAALTGYYEALTARPSVARVIDEARYFRPYFPLGWPEHVA